MPPEPPPPPVRPPPLPPDAGGGGGSFTQPAAGAMQLAKARFVADFERFGRGGGLNATRVVGFAVAVVLTVALPPVGVFLLVRVGRNYRRNKQGAAAARRAAALAAAAEPVMAYPLMVNSVLRQPGTTSAPGLVLIGFGPAARRPEFMMDVAIAVGSMDAADPDDEAALVDLMADEEYTPSRRRPVPPRVAGGADLYVCDLAIAPELLPGHHISDDRFVLPCLAEPGPAGRIVLMPHWLFAADGRPPDAAHERAYLSLAFMAAG